MTFKKAIAPELKVERLAKRRLRIYRDKVFDAIAATGLITKDIFDEHTDYDAISSTLKAADNLLAENLTSGGTNTGEPFPSRVLILVPVPVLLKTLMGHRRRQCLTKSLRNKSINKKL
jgi:hypothetical protein